MTEQTKAQRLADNLIKHLGGNTANEAAAELRRLDALNAELVAALEDAIDSMGRFASDQDSLGRDIIFLDNAIAALAKAKEQT